MKSSVTNKNVKGGITAKVDAEIRKTACVEFLKPLLSKNLSRTGPERTPKEPDIKVTIPKRYPTLDKSQPWTLAM